MIRALSGSPLLEDMITPTSKFVGEALEMRDVRTIFSGSKEDDKEKENRVVLIIGSSSAEKSDLIDFMCNYFYGVNPNEELRYHIANEKFNSQTPYRPIQCYIFNNTIMDIRPVLIDTPGCGESFDSNTSSFLNKWMLDNWKMRIDVIAFIISDLHRMTSHEEDDLQKVIDNLPDHMFENIVVFITSSDGSKLFGPLLRRIGLSKCPVFTISTGCVFQKPLEDRLNDEHRRRNWNKSLKELERFFQKMNDGSPVTISGLPFIDDAIYGVSESGSSRSSFYSPSQSTVIEVGTRTVTPPSSHPKPRPPTPPPKPKIDILSKTPNPQTLPPPIPKSPPPTKPPLLSPENSSIGIPLYNCNNNAEVGEERRIVSSPTPPPRPPNFSPPEPPENRITTVFSGNSTTHALTNAMIEQLKATSSRNSAAHYQYSSQYRYPDVVDSQMRDKEDKYEIASNMGPRRHSVPDDIRHYADETTPPPVEYDLADRYSTVDYMNQYHNQYGTRVLTRPSSRTNISVRDAHRLSREDLRIVDKAESSPTESGELRRMYSGRSASTIRPTDDINTSRYVYDTATRNYTSQEERQSRSTYVASDRRRWSKSSDARSETFITDPYYTGKDVVSGYGVTETRRSRTSLHSNGPELVHSENKYDYQQMQAEENQKIESGRISLNERQKRGQSEGSRQIYIDRRISPERRRKDQFGDSYTNIDMSDNPQYNISSRANPPVPQKPIDNTQRVNGSQVYEDRSVYEAYSQINRPISQGVPLSNQQNFPTRYDQVPEQQRANHYIIPKSMRGSPIQVRVHLSNKSSPNVVNNIGNQQYDTYGEPIYVRRPLDVTEEIVTTTTTTRKEEIEKKRKKKEEEIRRKKLEEERIQKSSDDKATYDAYDVSREHHGYGDRDAEQGLLEEEYNTRQFRRTTEQPRHTNYDPRGGLNYKRQNGADSTRNNNRKIVTKEESKIGWTPSNYTNPRDCFLNLLCFVIAPLVIIGIIVVIIVFVIIQ